jgi:hypothetical protein
MALVRCPTHKIPYNDENPRGCPACAREREGGGEAAVMQELARATRRTAGATATKTEAKAPPAARPSAPAVGLAPPVTEKPRAPAVATGRLEEFLWQLGRPRNILIGVALIAALGVTLLLTSGPEFVEEPHPAPFTGAPRPLPVEPNTPITTVFAVLGTRNPEPHPQASALARYSYGTDLTVDALSGRVYALSFSVPNRSWQGLRIGASPQNAQGALALLAPPADEGVPNPVAPQVRDGYVVYPSLDALPVRVLSAAVRPPNGCYDVRAELRPQIAGLLIDGDRRYAVAGREGTEPRWVVTRIQVVSRAMSGPYAGPPIC